MGCGGGGEVASADGVSFVYIDPLLLGNRDRDANSQPPPQGLVKSNIARLGQDAILAPSITLALAKMSVEAWPEAPQPAAASRVLSCGNNGAGSNGTVEYFFEDVDNSGTPGLGDRLTIRWSDCWMPEFTVAQTGAMVLTRIPPIDAGYSIAVHAAIAPGFVQLSGAAVLRRMQGSLVFQAGTGATADLWNVRSSAADDFQATYPAHDPSSKTVSISEIDFRKTLRYDQASVEVSIKSSFTSPITNGALRVETIVPLRAMIDTYPIEGRLRLEDTNNRQLLIEAVAGTRSQIAAATLKEVSEAPPGEGQELPWSSLAASTLWWGERGSVSVIQRAKPFEPTSLPLAPSTYAMIDLRVDSARELVVAAPQTPIQTSVMPVLRFQFSRPPVQPFAPRLRFYAQPTMAEILSGAPPSVNAIVQVQGALVLVTPASQLQYGRSYMLAVDQQLPGAEASVEAIDQKGNRARIPSLQFSTRVDLEAIIIPVGESLITPAQNGVIVDGSTSRALNAPITRYQWRQVSGPLVQFATPNQSRTMVSLAGPTPANSERVAIELQVIDALGLSAVKQTELTVLGSQFPLVVRARGEAGAWFLGGRSLVATEANGYLSVRSLEPGREFWIWFNNNNGDSIGVRAVAPAGQLLTNGTYEGAVWSPTAGQPTLWVQGGLCTGTTPSGRFEVRDLVMGGDGRATRIALDFEARCGGQGPAVRGSIRLDSAVPPPP